jgi:hypothetical protein
MIRNPLIALLVRLSGTPRQHAVFAVVYAAILATAVTLSYAATNPAEAQGVSAMLLTLLTLVQAVFLLMLGPGSIRGAVLRDCQSNMIESHRLAPMSDLTIVLGYLAGPPFRIFLLVGVGLLVGTYLAGHLGLVLGFPGTVIAGWHLSQLCLVPLAFMLAGLVLLTALASAGKTNVLGLLFVIGAFGGWALVPFVPGLMLLFGVFTGGLLFGLLSGNTSLGGDPWVVPWSMLLQTTIGAVFLRAACRKVRKPHLPMFSVELGLLWLLLVGGALLAGVAEISSYAWLLPDRETSGAAQILGSTVAFLLAAGVPLIAGAALRVQRDLGAALEPAPRFRLAGGGALVSLLLGALTAVLISLMYESLAPDSVTPELAEALDDAGLRAVMFAALTLGFWTDFALIRASLLVCRRVLPGILAAAVVKLLPLMIDGAAAWVREMSGANDQPYPLVFSGLSPIGTLLEALFYADVSWVGLGIQVVIASLATVLARWLHDRVRRAHAAAPADR